MNLMVPYDYIGIEGEVFEGNVTEVMVRIRRIMSFEEGRREYIKCHFLSS